MTRLDEDPSRWLSCVERASRLLAPVLGDDV